MANKQMNFSVDLLPSSNNNYSLGNNEKKWANVYANTLTGNLTGDVAGKLNTTRITLPAITGTGTTGADQGSSDTTTRYKPAVWTFNASISPVDGDIVTIKQPCAGHDYGTWLTLDSGLNYHPVVISTNSRITTQFTNGHAIMLAYDAAGTVSVYARGGAMTRTTITGVWRVLTTYDSNSNDIGYYHRRMYPNLKAGTGGIVPYTIIMQLPDGRWSSIVTSSISSGTTPQATGKAVNSNGFLVGRVLLMYANANYNADVNIDKYNIWSAYTNLVDARYSFNLENTTGNGFVGYAPVYIVGTIDNNGLFNLDTTKWWAQTLPTTDDGKVYIYIGDANDWSHLTFTEDKPVYWYKDGKIQLYSGYASGVALSNVTGADDLKAIEALSGTSGILKKTATNTWTLDTTAYTTNTGTVTSVAASGSGGISISGSPITTSGTITVGLNLSTAINGLGEGTSPAQLNDYLVAQYAGGGTTTTTYHRRKVSNVVNGTVVKNALGTDSTHSNQFLRKDGTWVTPPYPVTSVAGNTGAIAADTLRTALGLSNAMHFLGVTTTNISTGTANTTATIAIDGSNVVAAAGDVVLYNETSQEYVWGNGKWNLLGDESSYKVKQNTVSDPTASGNSTTFISTISQNANGVISVSKANLPIASKTAAGIVSDSTQEFKGIKIFGAIRRRAYDGDNVPTRYPGNTLLQTNAGTTVAKYHYDIGDATNITTGKFVFRQYSPNTTPDTSTTGFYEEYCLPTVTSGMVANKSYSILTTKDLSFSITGNATTATTATNLANAPSLAVSNTTQITVTAGEKTSNAFTVPFATSADKLTTIEITSENDIPFDNDQDGASTATYKGSGNTWTGDIDSMKYAGILHVANDSRSWEIWARRELDPSSTYPHSPLHWRNRLVGTEGLVGWASESIIPDIDATNNANGNLGTTSQPIYAKGGRLLPCAYTLNVASSENTTSKIYLIGAASQITYATTNSNSYVYATNGALSVGSLKLNANTAEEKVNIEYNTTSECITFSFE